jgi:hypothetical protein
MCCRHVHFGKYCETQRIIIGRMFLVKYDDEIAMTMTIGATRATMNKERGNV